MTRKNKRGKYSLYSLMMCLAVALTCMVCVMVPASEEDRMPALVEGQNGTLTVSMTYRDPAAADETQSVRPLAGVGVELVRVADLTVNGGSADYTLLPAFAETGIEFSGMTASASVEAAQVLQSHVEPGTEVHGTADSNGNVVFADLVPGMYLLYQKENANAAYSVDAIGSALISVPLPVKQQGGNQWQYEVTCQPKTELTAVHRNGRIEVIKYLYDATHNLTFQPPQDVELTFYVGLFLDKECTQPVPNTQELPLKIKNSDRGKVVFENLETDRTYYVAETDGQGHVISVIEVDNVKYNAEYPDGQSVTITREKPEGSLTFRNVIDGDLPEGYFYIGTLRIVKETRKNGEAYPMTGTFYAGIFRDKDLKELVEVVALNLQNQSQVSVSMDVDFGNRADDQLIYYVTETDKDGKPLDMSAQAFTMTMDPSDGKLPVGPKLPTHQVTIINDFGTKPSVTPSGDTPPGGNTPPGSNPPRTGDDTPIVGYVVMLLAAAAVITAGWIIRRKVKK